MFKKFIKGRLFTILVGLLIGAWISVTIIPASYWYEPVTVNVQEYNYGKGSPTIDFVRTIKREFRGKWRVEIMKREKNDRWSLYCTADSGEYFGYEPYRVVSEDLDLSWWVDGDPGCNNLKTGSYIMTTCWNVKIPLVPIKETCMASNIFNIKEES